jgi:hypothetical protein
MKWAHGCFGARGVWHATPLRGNAGVGMGGFVGFLVGRDFRCFAVLRMTGSRILVTLVRSRQAYSLQITDAAT